MEVAEQISPLVYWLTPMAAVRQVQVPVQVLEFARMIFVRVAEIDWARTLESDWMLGNALRG